MCDCKHRNILQSTLALVCFFILVSLSLSLSKWAALWSCISRTERLLHSISTLHRRDGRRRRRREGVLDEKEVPAPRRRGEEDEEPAPPPPPGPRRGRRAAQEVLEDKDLAVGSLPPAGRLPAPVPRVAEGRLRAADAAHRELAGDRRGRQRRRLLLIRPRVRRTGVRPAGHQRVRREDDRGDLQDPAGPGPAEPPHRRRRCPDHRRPVGRRLLAGLCRLRAEAPPLQ